VKEAALANIGFDKAYDKAIEAKQIEEQKAEQKRYELIQAQRQAEIVAAQAESPRTQIRRRIRQPQTSRSPGPPRDAAPAGEPVAGPKAAGLWRPTRCKGEPASTRRQACEGRPGGPAIGHRICGQQH